MVTPQCSDDNVVGVEGWGRLGVSDCPVKEGDNGGTTEVAGIYDIARTSGESARAVPRPVEYSAQWTAMRPGGLRK